MNKNWNVNWNDVKIQMVWEIIPCHLVISYRCLEELVASIFKVQGFQAVEFLDPENGDSKLF
jgi:hypothetical protein